MTVYEIPNIEHCDVTPIGTVGYRIRSHEGWYIHLNNGVEDTVNHWTTMVAMPVNSDFSIVEIRAEADLPEGAEINNVDGPEPEVM